ncbi:MAG: hypothetical protein IKD72_00090, partial [Clostridia bacterium]|nr:hypothetical protein [Clostridia bacterium]
MKFNNAILSHLFIDFNKKSANFIVKYSKKHECSAEHARECEIVPSLSAGLQKRKCCRPVFGSAASAVCILYFLKIAV